MQNTTPRQPKGTQDHNNQKKQQEYGDRKTKTIMIRRNTDPHTHYS